MSYARKGEDGSDIYLMHGSSGWECHGCELTGAAGVVGGWFATDSMADLIAHLKAHVLANHSVPEHVFARLFCEMFGLPFKTHIMRAMEALQLDSPPPPPSNVSIKKGVG